MTSATTMHLSFSQITLQKRRTNILTWESKRVYRIVLQKKSYSKDMISATSKKSFTSSKHFLSPNISTRKIKTFFFSKLRENIVFKIEYSTSYEEQINIIKSRKRTKFFSVLQYIYKLIKTKFGKVEHNVMLKIMY